MPSKSVKTRQDQLKYFESAVAQRIEILKTKIADKNLMEKDPVLRHLKGKASQIRKTLKAIDNLKGKKASKIVKKGKGKKKAENETE